MKTLIIPQDFTEFEVAVIKNPEMYLNEYLQNTFEISNDKKENEMYSFAKKKFQNLISKNKIEKIVDQKFRNHLMGRKFNPEIKKSILRRYISSLEKKLQSKQDELNNLMGEPLHMIESE